MKFTTAFVALLAALPLVAAVAPTDLSACGQTCLKNALAAQKCTGETDLACVCSDGYQAAVTTCIITCPSTDITLALQLKAQRCSASSAAPQPSSAAPSPAKPSTASPSPSPAKPSTASPSPAKPSAASSAAPKPSSAAPSPAKPSTASPSPVKPSVATPSPAKPSTVSPSSVKPSPAKSSAAAPTASSVPLPDLSKLSSCALMCVVGQIGASGCTGPTDTACICTAGYTNSVSQCIAAKCPILDALPALDLSRQMCPQLGLPDLSPLSTCAKTCTLQALKDQKCQGPLDTNCMCTKTFTNAVSGCILNSCPVLDAVPALQLSRGMCPSLGLPNLGKLSSCGQTCVLSAIKSNRCDNPLDQSCMCGLKGISLAANAGLCVLFRGCGFFTNIRDLISATLVQLGQCTRRSRRAIEDKNMSYAPRDLVEHWELQQERTIGEIFRRGAVDARAVAELERAINELAARM